MEKRISDKQPGSRILITGPESSGKTELATFLACHFGGKLIPEFARDYVEALHRPYTRKDLEIIARKQVDDYHSCVQNPGPVFFDTWLIITKVWFEVVYGNSPSWIEEELYRGSFKRVLLCAPDIPWIPDPVRENGGEMRMKLYEIYRHTLDQYGYPWTLITGSGKARTDCALNALNKIL